MFFPEDMTQEDIEQFEYEYNRMRDIEEGTGFWEINAELQILADQHQQELISDFDAPPSALG